MNDAATKAAIDACMRECVRQALRNSEWSPYAEPVEMNDRGQVTSKRVDRADEFLRILEGWGFVVVSKHDVPNRTTV